MVFAIRQVPQAAGPEILLAGRSNAGKSTLLNEILGALVAEGVSKNRGKTSKMDSENNGKPY